jgi:leucyl-tRNA synthetase
MYLGFMGPYGVTDNYPWDPNRVVGVRRFLERVWKLGQKTGAGFSSSNSILHKAIKKIGEDIEEYKFNTATSQMMILMNAWEKEETVSTEDFKTFLRLLAPFAPHITEELWHELGETESIHLASWPTYDPAKLVDETITIAIQVNGKLRAEISVSKDLSEEEIKVLALKNGAIIGWIEKGEVKRIIYVPGRLINIVM